MSVEQSDVAEFIIDHFSGQGLEIQSTGDDNIVVNLPPTFRDITTFCESLFKEFGSVVDMEYDNESLKAIVWKDESNVIREKSPKKRGNCLSCFLFVALVFILIAYIIKTRLHFLRDDIVSILLTFVDYI